MSENPEDPIILKNVQLKYFSLEKEPVLNASGEVFGKIEKIGNE